MAEVQSLNNHARVVRGYLIAFLLLLVNLGWAIWRLAARPSSNAIDDLLLAIALVLIAYYTRHFALTVQDRVIRLEVRLRLNALLPSELQARIDELSLDQLIALRFAGDGELPALTAKVLDEKLTSRAAIKSLVRDWRADDLRA